MSIQAKSPKRIAIVNAGLHGHVNPTLGITEALVKRGHDVRYFVVDEFRAKVEATGAHFKAYGLPMPMMAADPKEFRKHRNPQMFAEMMAAWRKTLPELTAMLDEFKPDRILYDFFVIPAHLFAQQSGVPAVKFYTTYASNETFSLWDYIKTFKPDLDMPLNNPDLELLNEAAPTNLVFMPKAFQVEGDTFDSRYHFVGPCLRMAEVGADTFTPKETGRPLVLVGMGSMLTKQSDFYKTCFEVFRNRPVDVVMAIGSEVDPSSLGTAPANITLLKHMPQLALLKRARVFISHGGMNSTMEGLSFGVPLLVTPHTEEQEVSARRVQELKLGLHLNPDDITVQTLGAAFDDVLNSATFKANAKQMAATIKSAGGTPRAVEVIEGARG